MKKETKIIIGSAVFVSTAVLFAYFATLLVNNLRKTAQNNEPAISRLDNITKSMEEKLPKHVEPKSYPQYDNTKNDIWQALNTYFESNIRLGDAGKDLVVDYTMKKGNELLVRTRYIFYDHKDSSNNARMVVSVSYDGPEPRKNLLKHKAFDTDIVHVRKKGKSAYMTWGINIDKAGGVFIGKKKLAPHLAKAFVDHFNDVRKLIASPEAINNACEKTFEDGEPAFGSVKKIVNDAEKQNKSGFGRKDRGWKVMLAKDQRLLAKHQRRLAL